MGQHDERNEELHEELKVLLERARSGDDGAIARLLTLVESGGPARRSLLETLHADTGRAHRIGLAGPPGAGKSTLLRELAGRYRREGRRVGAVAVDPTSARSGGALLGDRVRMHGLELDDGVFIRSLATRGHGGGLSLAAGLVVDVLDALGFDPILVETVGVGQGELDVARKTHSLVLLLLPGAGDAVQLMKAGLLEMADLLVVNKADRDGASELAALLRAHVEESSSDGTWQPPVLLTQAYRGEGVDELLTALVRHRDHLQESGEWTQRRRDAVREQVRQLAQGAILQGLWRDPAAMQQLDAVVEAVLSGAQDPVGGADAVARGLLKRRH